MPKNKSERTKTSRQLVYNAIERAIEDKDLRLAQLLECVRNGDDLFYLEDDQLALRIHEWAGKQQQLNRF